MRFDRVAGFLPASWDVRPSVWLTHLAYLGIGGVGVAYLHHLWSLPGHFPVQRGSSHGGRGACHAVIWTRVCRHFHVLWRAGCAAHHWFDPALAVAGVRGRITRRCPSVVGRAVPPAFAQSRHAPGLDLWRWKCGSAIGIGHGQQPRNPCSWLFRR